MLLYTCFCVNASVANLSDALSVPATLPAPVAAQLVAAAHGHALQRQSAVREFSKIARPFVTSAIALFLL